DFKSCSQAINAWLGRTRVDDGECCPGIANADPDLVICYEIATDRAVAADIEVAVCLRTRGVVLNVVCTARSRRSGVRKARICRLHVLTGCRTAKLRRIRCSVRS